MRVLAIDYGAKRIGLALCDKLEITTRPAGTIHRGPNAQVIERIVHLVEWEDVEHIVLGLPLNMNGSEGPAAAKVREFAAKLTDAVEIPITFQDERLTSVAAEEWMAAEGRSPKQRKRESDEYAARIILQDFLASRQRRP